MRVTHSMAQICEVAGGVVFVNSPNVSGGQKLLVSLGVWDLTDPRRRPEGSRSNN